MLLLLLFIVVAAVAAFVVVGCCCSRIHCFVILGRGACCAVAFRSTH